MNNASHSPRPGSIGAGEQFETARQHERANVSLLCPHCHAAYDGPADEESARCPACGGEWRFAALDSTAPYAADDESTLVVDRPGGTKTAVRRIDKFALERLVGHGSFGDVWRARDTALERIVAVKIPRRGDLSESEAEYFLREARAAAQLKHPHIVAVHEAGESDGAIFIVSDFVEGRSLKERLADRRLTTRESIELAIKIADALHHAHEAGVVHRDLKPANIMIDEAGEPLVMDFGLAKRDTGEVTMTIAGNVLGTPAYMSPEQARGEGHTADRRADIYSLGVMLFEFLTGERPFRGDARMLIAQIANDLPPSPRKLDSRVPRDLETICMKCLETEPSRRFKTAADLAADLRRWLDGEPLVSRPVGWTGRVWRWCARRPAVAVLTAVASLLALAVIIGGPFLYFKERSARQFAEEQQEEAHAARKAELEAIAEREFNNARRAAQIGQWRKAIEHLEAAEQAHFPRKFELELLRARALRSIANLPKWAEAIERLESLPKTKPQHGLFLVMKAELLRFQGKRDDGLKLIEQALKSDLPASYRSYARGLLAKRTPEAAAHFEAAVKADPFFHDASVSLVATLVMLGRLDDAKQRASVAHRVFPDDPVYSLWLALVAALRQDKRDMEYWTKQLGNQLGKQNTDFFRKALIALEKTIEALLKLEQPKQAANVELLGAWFQLNQIQAETQRADDRLVGLSAVVHSVINSLPPAMSRALQDFGDFSLLRLAMIRSGNDKRFNEAIATLAKVNPECTINWLHSATLVQKKQYAEGSVALERAAELPSMIPGVKPLAMYLAAVASYVNYQTTRSLPALRRAASLARRRVPMRPLSDEEAGLLANIGGDARDFPLLRAVVRNRLEQNPNDRKWLYKQLDVEALAGNYLHVVNLANELLEQLPNDPLLLAYRKGAIRHVQRMAGSFPKRFPAIAPKPKRRKQKP